jgi:hypothetical protein
MIMKKGLMWMLVFAYALILALIISAARAQEKANARYKLELQMHDIQKYQEGFVDGMNATLRHVKLATNVVEIAPIIVEMKH